MVTLVRRKSPILKTAPFHIIKLPWRNWYWPQLPLPRDVLRPWSSVTQTNFRARSVRFVGIDASTQSPSQEIFTGTFMRFTVTGDNGFGRFTVNRFSGGKSDSGAKSASSFQTYRGSRL